MQRGDEIVRFDLARQDGQPVDAPASDTSVSAPEPEEIRMRRRVAAGCDQPHDQMDLGPAGRSVRNRRMVAGSSAHTPQISGGRQPEMQIRSAESSPSMPSRRIAPASLLIGRYRFGGSLIAATPSKRGPGARAPAPTSEIVRHVFAKVAERNDGRSHARGGGAARDRRGSAQQRRARREAS